MPLLGLCLNASFDGIHCKIHTTKVNLNEEYTFYNILHGYVTDLAIRAAILEATR